MLSNEIVCVDIEVVALLSNAGVYSVGSYRNGMVRRWDTPGGYLF